MGRLSFAYSAQLEAENTCLSVKKVQVNSLIVDLDKRCFVDLSKEKINTMDCDFNRSVSKESGPSRSAFRDRKCFAEAHQSIKSQKLLSLRRNEIDRTLDLPFQNCTRSLLNLFQHQGSSRQSPVKPTIPTPPPRRRRAASVNPLPKCESELKVNTKVKISQRSQGLSLQSCTRSLINLFRATNSSEKSLIRTFQPTPPPRRKKAASLNNLPNSCNLDSPKPLKVFQTNQVNLSTFHSQSLDQSTATLSKSTLSLSEGDQISQENVLQQIVAPKDKTLNGSERSLLIRPHVKQQLIIVSKL